MFIKKLEKIREKVIERNNLIKESKDEYPKDIKQLENDIKKLKDDVELFVLTLKNVNIGEIENTSEIEKKYLKNEKYLYVYLFFIEKYYYDGEKQNDVIKEINEAGIDIAPESILKRIKIINEELNEDKVAENSKNISDEQLNELKGLYNLHI